MRDDRGGYIKIYRKIEDSAIWNEKPCDRLHAWIWLLLHANFKKAEVNYKGKTITIERGQLLTSYDKLAEAWGWSRNKVIRFTTWLTNEGMIAKNGYANGTAITIENYAFYQDGRYAGGTADGTPDGTPDGTQSKKERRKEGNPTRAGARGAGSATLKWQEIKRKEAEKNDGGGR